MTSKRYNLFSYNIMRDLYGLILKDYKYTIKFGTFYNVNFIKRYGISVEQDSNGYVILHSIERQKI